MAVQQKGDVQEEPRKDIYRIMTEQPWVVEQAINRGIREALLRHKQAGLPVAVSRDGKVVLIQPEDIPS